MSFTLLLNTTVDVETQVQTKSPTGGAAVSWVAKSSDARARVDQLNAEAVLAYGRLGYRVSHRVYLETDLDLNIKDRIVFNGEAYHVRIINNAGGHMGHHWEVDVERLPL